MFAKKPQYSQRIKFLKNQHFALFAKNLVQLAVKKDHSFGQSLFYSNSQLMLLQL